MNHEVHDAKLVSITPNAEENIVYMARVSNPQNQHNNETAPRLIRYLLKHKHFSPFEMASMQVEINTTRAIAAQVLRHRSFSFQEFSQRYSSAGDLPAIGLPHLRSQDLKNKQASHDDLDPEMVELMNKQIQHHDIYKRALKKDIGEIMPFRDIVSFFTRTQEKRPGGGSVQTQDGRLLEKWIPGAKPVVRG